MDYVFSHYIIGAFYTSNRVCVTDHLSCLSPFLPVFPYGLLFLSQILSLFLLPPSLLHNSQPSNYLSLYVPNKFEDQHGDVTLFVFLNMMLKYWAEINVFVSQTRFTKILSAGGKCLLHGFPSLSFRFPKTKETKVFPNSK